MNTDPLLLAIMIADRRHDLQRLAEARTLAKSTKRGRRRMRRPLVAVAQRLRSATARPTRRAAPAASNC